MPDIIQAIRGMHDILPSEIALWQHVEAIFRDIYRRYGFIELRTPIVEKTELFKRTIGEVTDIVEKEMYTFIDRNQESLSLRPEGTASCARAGIQNGLLYNQTPRLWYGGPFFRHERPQKGRTRQFYQYGAEIFGLQGPDIDAELIMLSADIFTALALQPHVKLQINSLGTPDARMQYRALLIEYFEKYKNDLDEESLQRLHKNPMRILDSKNPELQKIIQSAPKLLDHLDSASQTHFTLLQEYLHSANIDFEINPYIVRGLDYYTRTVFEWVTTQLGAQATLCAGGRYDGLVEQLGGKATPAVGYAFGIDRLVLLMQATNSWQDRTPPPLAYIMTSDEKTFGAGIKLARIMREKFPTRQIALHTGGGSFKNQFKKANKSLADFAILIGEDEMLSNTFTIKDLKNHTEQISMDLNGLMTFFCAK